MTAINNLPFETISSIFLLISSPNDVDREDQHPIPSRYPLLLGRVCSYWRHVIHTTPQLWTNIFVKSCNDLKNFDLRAARTYLSLCGPSLALSLHLIWGDIQPSTAEDTHAFTALITPHATRWTTTHISVFIHDVGVSFITMTLESFTSLASLQFSFPTTTSCPHPHQYTSSGLGLRFRPVDRRTLPSLVHLSLNFKSIEQPSALAIPLLDYLTLPSLSTFTLYLSTELDGLDRDDIWELFRKLLNRSHPPLTAIYASIDAYPDEILVLRILRLTPLLEKARGLWAGVETLSELVSSTNSRTPVAPNLTEISISAVPDDVDSVVRMLSSRWAGGEGALKKVVVLVPDFRIQVLVERLRVELHGLEIVEEEWVEMCSPMMLFD